VIIPDWDDKAVKRGTKIRIALWLLSEVGEGNTFTKAQLRDAFPGIEQADRRMRDLRDHEWVIDTAKEDSGLGLNELRFVKAGDQVWQPGKATPKGSTLTAKERMAIMASDDYMCVVCGIAGGESYPDAAHQTAQLSVSRHAEGPSRAARYVTECKRCRAGSSVGATPDLESLLAELDQLPAAERRILASWIASGRRTTTATERIWSGYRRLPADDRDALAQRLG
jgi:hypothetical protein